MAQKIIKIGKSAGVTIPKHLLERLGVKPGDEIAIEAAERQDGFFVKTKGRRIAVDKEFAEWADDFIEAYRPALDCCAVPMCTGSAANGLLRQYFPKGTDFSKVSTREIKHVQRRLNDRPRAVLDYEKPDEVINRLVALKV